MSPISSRTPRATATSAMESVVMNSSTKPERKAHRNTLSVLFRNSSLIFATLSCSAAPRPKALRKALQHVQEMRAHPGEGGPLALHVLFGVAPRQDHQDRYRWGGQDQQGGADPVYR